MDPADIDALVDDRRSSEVFADYTRTPDGPLPARPDLGGEWETTGSHPPVIRDGAYTNESAEPIRSATYVSQRLSADITRVGGTFRFPATAKVGTSGAAGFISFTKTITGWPDDLPESGMHLAVSMRSAQVLAVVDDGFIPVLDYVFDPPLEPEREYAVDVVIDGFIAVFDLPDGRHLEIGNPYVESKAGTYVCFEIFENDPTLLERPEITRVWADTTPVRASSRRD